MIEIEWWRLLIILVLVELWGVLLGRYRWPAKL
jgi:hypothetical protein